MVGLLSVIKRRLPVFWSRLVGLPGEFPLENRAFHAISILSLAILTIFLPFNVVMGLYELSILITVIIISQAVVYYLSRVKRRYYAGTALYIAASYLIIILTFYYNSGSQGPALLLFFLTFMLLVAATPKQKHVYFVCAHVLIATTLLAIEYYDKGFIAYTYRNDADRYIDLGSSYIVTLAFIYFLLIYLRNNYAREQGIAEASLQAIEKQNAELEKLNVEKNKLFSIISHDLRSPLNSIQSYLELVAAQALEPHEREEMEGALLDMTRNTSDMLFNLLTWSKAQMEGVQVNLRHIYLYDSLSNLLELERAIAAKKQITLSYDISKSIMLVADTDMLQLVMRNLMNNAIKFTNPGGMVLIDASVENNICIISVSDTGIGIAPAQLPHLYALSHTHSYGTQNEKGVGLGLVLCKEFIELQKGRIHVESKLGKGTTFHVYLPCE